MNAPDLHIALARQIAGYLQDHHLAAGTHLAESRLTQALGVSRTPVRAALAILAERGVLESIPHQGYFLKRAGEEIDVEGLDLPQTANESFYENLLRDRASGRLPDVVHESVLLERYQVAKGQLRKTLLRVAQEGLVQRLPGHGWRFAPSLSSADARLESYRFRILVECGVLQQPGFEPLIARFAQSRAAHERLLKRPRMATPHEFFEVNSEFHEMLAAASRNRFLLQAVQTQNALRKLSELSDFQRLEPRRIEQSCREHLAILDAIESGQRKEAARLMRAHLQGAAGKALAEANEH
jgi:DNA-binding GntR family transcriptional regulator